MHVERNRHDHLLWDPDHDTRLVSMTPATGWHACYKTRDGAWSFLGVPMFMTVAVSPKTDPGLPWLSMFGVHEELGRLARMDVPDHFMGYAHLAEFEEVGVKLFPDVAERLERGEIMCGDPDRFLERAA